MRIATKIMTVSAACVALAVGSFYALSGDSERELRASPVDLDKLAALAADPSEAFIAPVVPALLATVPIETGDVAPVIATIDTRPIDTRPIETEVVHATAETLGAAPAPEVDWPTSTEDSMSAYKKTKMDRDVFRSIEFVN